MLPRSSNIQGIPSRRAELILQLQCLHSGQFRGKQFFLPFYKPFLGAEANVLCAWFSVQSQGLVQMLRAHHCWEFVMAILIFDQRTLKNSVMDVFWRLWKWAYVELEWQSRLQHLWISHTSTKENGKLNGKNFLKDFSVLKQVETWNIQSLPLSSLKCLWKFMGNTKFM